MNYQISYYNDSVKAEIDHWPKSINASFIRITERMQVSGPNLGLPYTRSFGNGLFEIRAKGYDGIGRAFFCQLINRQVVVLHGYIKKSPTTPMKELQLARKRLKEIKS